jgi:hypothetical protein
MSVNDLTDYELRNLPAHLIVLGRTQDLARLLWRGAEGQAENLWYGAKRRALGLGPYLEDLELLLGAISSDRTVDPAARALGMLRYALLSTSVNSGFEKYPAKVFGSAVGADIWSITEAIDHATRIPDSEVRASAMLELLPVVTNQFMGL